MQRGGVLAAADDRVVAEVVAHRPRPAEERALDPALAVPQDVAPLARAVLEAQDGRVAGGLELTDLPRVLEQALLGGHPGQLLVERGVAGQQGVDLGGEAPQRAGLGRVAARSSARRSTWRTSMPQRAGDLVRRGPAPGPQLAVLPVAEELVGLARGPRVGRRAPPAVLDDQDRVGGLVAGVVGVGGVGPEAVVGVVGPHLVATRRQHQALAREGLGEPGPALGRGPRHRVGRQVELALAPALPHELGPGGGHLGVVGLRVRGGVRLGPRLLSIHARQPTRASRRAQ